VPTAQGVQQSPPACGAAASRPVQRLTGVSHDTDGDAAGRNSATVADASAHKNPAIQCLRGLAALSVALHHAWGYSLQQFGDGGWLTAFDGRFGVVGVAIFFAISGLLMAELIQRTDPWRFLAHRIVRIYPAYLLAVAIAAPLTAFVGNYRQSFHGFSLLLVPVGHRAYYLNVEWTLIFECTYYVALFLIAAAGWHRYMNRIALVWLAVILAAPLFMGSSSELRFQLHTILLAPANAAFACGLLIPWIGRQWIARHVRIPPGTGILALCIMMAMVPNDQAGARWAAGAAAALLVFDVMRFKVPPRTVLGRVQLGLQVLGDWSYALYLIHVPTILLVYHFWPATAGTGAASLSAAIAAVILSAGFGTLDVWMYRRLKSAVDALREEECRRRVNVYVVAFVAVSLIGMII
jgi:exopolysaccharide production protein ExoZ